MRPSAARCGWGILRMCNNISGNVTSKICTASFIAFDGLLLSLEVAQTVVAGVQAACALLASAIHLEHFCIGNAPLFYPMLQKGSVLFQLPDSDSMAAAGPRPVCEGEHVVAGAMHRQRARHDDDVTGWAGARGPCQREGHRHCGL